MSEYVARNEAIDRVAVGNADWTSWAVLALQDVAATCADLTSDDVWRVLKARGIPGPTEPRAMGPVMLSGVKKGWLKPTDRVRSSDDPASPNHARPQRVYESAVFGTAKPPAWPTRPSRFRCHCGAGSMTALTATLSPSVWMGTCAVHGKTMFVKEK